MLAACPRYSIHTCSRRSLPSLHGIPADVANVKLDLLPLTQDLVAQFRSDFPNGVPVYDFKARSKTYNPDAETAVFEMKYSN